MVPPSYRPFVARHGLSSLCRMLQEWWSGGRLFDIDDQGFAEDINQAAAEAVAELQTRAMGQGPATEEIVCDPEVECRCATPCR